MIVGIILALIINFQFKDNTMSNLTVTVAANVTYSGFTYNTPLIIEYEHTGIMYFKKENHYTLHEDIAQRWKQEGKKVIEKPGYYFMKRLAIPSNGGLWYINNEGDSYKINKLSKYANKIHEQLSNNINPFTQ